jgi:hypothetical protein
VGGGEWRRWPPDPKQLAGNRAVKLSPGGLPVLAGLSLWVATACGGPFAEAGAGRWEVGDTVFVHNAVPVLSGTGLLTEVARYGARDGPHEYLLSEIYRFAVGPAGEVFVHDRGGGLRRFEADGRFGGWVAPSGQGPGEVRFLASLGVGGDGTIVGWDVGNQRLMWFRPDGRWNSVPVPLHHAYPRYGEDGIVFGLGGSVWVGFHPAAPVEGGIPHPRPIFAQVGEGGGLTDTLFTPPDAPGPCPELSTAEYRIGFWEDSREPFIPKYQWALGPDGSLAVGCPAEYSFDLLRPGRNRLRISRAWTPIRMPAEEREFWMGWRWLPPLPSSRPAYARIVLPGDGRTWVWPVEPSEIVRSPVYGARAEGLAARWRLAQAGSWDVFLEDGRWLGRVLMPEEARYSGYPTTTEVRIRGDTLWARAFDEWDAEYIVRYQVAWPGGS